MTTSTLNQIKQLEEQLATLSANAHEEALPQAEGAIEILETLGYQYSLVQDSGQKLKRTRGGTRKPRADRDCPICLSQTTPPHDGRHHKNQTIKGPFTVEELREKGLTIVGKPAVTTTEQNDQSSWAFEEA